MYPRVALPKLTTSEEFGFYVEFYCWLDCSILVTRIPSLHKFNNKSMTSSKSPKNWSYWNHIIHLTDYSRDSGTGKYVRFAIAALPFVPIGFLLCMTTIQRSDLLIIFSGGESPFFYWFFHLVVKASPSTKIFFLLIPAGNAKISAIERKTIKSKGNLPIPHSEKARANVVSCIYFF